MFKYTPQNQMSIFDFKLSFESKLDPENRWVRLSKVIPWDDFAAIYGKSFSETCGTKSIDARVVIGALIIKHLEKKGDQETIQIIQENPYMQFFLGLDRFTFEPVFDPSLFVHIRKRLGNAEFDRMNQLVIQKASKINGKMDSSKSEDGDDQPKEEPKNKGKMQSDATIADANIKYPTDLNLLNESREKSEEIIDKFCAELGQEKPRTYRREARKSWLNISKKKSKSNKEIRKGIKQQLSYLKRNLKSIDKILDNHPEALGLLSKRSYKYLLVIKELYRQQLEMYVENKKSVSHRIVSIHQPHIRPMVRGKEGRKVEFGTKINVSLQNGYARIDQMSFEAFNEGTCLIAQIENYKKLHGYYPEVVQTDDIYMNRENRNFLKEKGIRHTGRPLGRKPKTELTHYQKQKLKKERAERNQIEGKFGEGKTKYNLNKIMAKLESTTESWIGAIFFVMNILKLSKDFLCLFLETQILNIFAQYSVCRQKNIQFQC